MKILTVNTRYIGGGGAAYIANMLHREINKIDGYSSTFLYGRGVNGDKNSIRITYRNMDYLSALSYRLFAKELNFNKDIEEQIVKCDIVHLHNLHGYYINYVKLFKLLKKHNKKIIWTLHDMWPITGRCAYSFGCEKWKECCGNCENKKSYPISMSDRSNEELELKRRVIGDIDEENMIIISPSRWLADMCKKSYLRKYKINVVPNGIEHEKIKASKEEIRKKYNIPRKKKTILFVAADVKDERKGIKYILDIIPKCLEYNFIAMGKKIENVQFDNFIQLGYINSREKINEVYSMVDVFVIPSLDDNFPTTVLEAFANGVPAIGFNQGGIPEQIDELTGKICPNINSEDLMESIKVILEDEERLNYYSKNAREKFVNKYKLDVFINSYIEKYKELGESK